MGQIDQALVDVVLIGGTEFTFEVVGHKWVPSATPWTILPAECD